MTSQQLKDALQAVAAGLQEGVAVGDHGVLRAVALEAADKLLDLESRIRK